MHSYLPRASTPAPWLGGMIQRQCKQCGSEQAGEGETCGRCAGESAQAGAQAVQTKLRISRPGDALEREADSVADAVLRGGPVAAQLGHATPQVQRDTDEEELDDDAIASALDEAGAESAAETAGGEATGEAGGVEDEVSADEEVEAAVAETEAGEEEDEVQLKAQDSGGAATALAQVPRGGGQPLAAGVRGFMERRFGHSFADVAVHADSAAQASAESLNARAYTLGSHVYFGAGEYRPDAADGQRLLAHELTHVLQQRGGTPQLARAKDDKKKKKTTTGGKAPKAPKKTTEKKAAGGKKADSKKPDTKKPDTRKPSSKKTDAKKAASKKAATKKTAVKKSIVVDLSDQTAKALEDGKVVKSMPISSGKPGSPTDIGNFSVSEKDKNHRSNIYGTCTKSGKKSKTGAKGCPAGDYLGADMKYFLRFNGAEGLHRGVLPGHPDSHGCVRLSDGNAKWLFDWTPKGTPVKVQK